MRQLKSERDSLFEELKQTSNFASSSIAKKKIERMQSPIASSSSIKK